LIPAATRRRPIAEPRMRVVIHGTRIVLMCVGAGRADSDFPYPPIIGQDEACTDSEYVHCTGSRFGGLGARRRARISVGVMKCASNWLRW
jgi:hypothetical protein